MAPPIIMHVNYCEQGQTIAEICRKVAGWGYDGVEFRRVPTALPYTTPEAYLDEIVREKQASGLRQVVFGIGVRCLYPDAEQRRQEVQEAARFMRLAAERFDLTVCNTSAQGPLGKGSADASEEAYEAGAECFRALGDVAGELGFRLAFEIHMGLIHDLPEPTMKLLSMIDRPSVGANLDYGNIIYLKGAPSLQDSIKTVKEKLYYVHLKNSLGLRDGQRLKVGLEDGEINNREFLRTLQQIGYPGPICPEFPRNGDREWHAQRDLHYLKQLLAELSWQ
ncbi:MAG: sugar phosphate isomerase/epimerase [Armatimonadetes bacterium]|nr:sugar phosphate isomerase/epimerase [Armatimonadota bacterium]